MSNEQELRALNDGYIRAHVEANAAWYDAHLADDFICVRADGSVIDKAAFVAATRPPSGVEHYQLDDIRVRVNGDSGFVSALGTWRKQDGSAGQTRYIDSYVRTANGWKVVSAQLTRVPQS
jgi:ketosteroid isomerase-like protein